MLVSIAYEPRAGMHPRRMVRCMASSWTKDGTRQRVKVLSRGRAGIRTPAAGLSRAVHLKLLATLHTWALRKNGLQASEACGVRTRADAFPAHSVGHLGMRLRVVSKWLPLRLQSRKVAITESSEPVRAPFLLLPPALLTDGLSTPLLPEHAH
jgi:hypothetical protein